MASNNCCWFSECFDNIKACLVLMVAFLVFFCISEKNCWFFHDNIVRRHFCFRINWRLTSSCWLSRGLESTESLPIASVVFLVCFFFWDWIFLSRKNIDSFKILIAFFVFNQLFTRLSERSENTECSFLCSEI